MALLWVDGFDKYGTVGSAINPSDIVTWKYTGHYDEQMNIVAGSGAGNALQLDGTSQYLVTPQLTGNRTLIFGFAFRLANNVTNDQLLVDIRSPDMDGETIGYRQLRLNIQTVNGDNQIRANRGNTGIGTTTTLNIQQSTWYYLECKVYCDNSAGTLELKIDGTTVLDITGTDTQHSSGYNWYSRLLWTDNGINHIQLDDLYICDGSGSDNNDFLGTCNVQTLSPSADVLTEWTQDFGSNLYDRINEDQQHAGNISEDTSGNQATFEMDNVTINGTPIGLMYCCESNQNGIFGKYAKALAQQGTGTINDSIGNFMPGTTNPLTGSVIMEKDADGSAWTNTTINSLRVGVELS
jgi:hypothetical protein